MVSKSWLPHVIMALAVLTALSSETTSHQTTEDQCPRVQPTGCTCTWQCTTPPTDTTKTTTTTTTTTTKTPTTTATEALTTTKDPTTTTTEEPTTPKEPTTTTEELTTTTTEELTTTTEEPTTTTTLITTTTPTTTTKKPTTTTPDKPSACKSAMNKNTCYWVEKDQGTFDEMEKECTRNNGNLATIDSQETSDFVQRFVESSTDDNRHRWIGHIKGNTRWNDGTLFDWTNYPNGEDNGADGSCIDMCPVKWNYIGCTNTRPGLCQIRISNDCLETYRGVAYRGERSVTLDGLTCQKWAVNTPLHHNDQPDLDGYPDTSLEEASNYCRNPSNDPEGPWCYTTDADVRYGYCDVPLCYQPASVGLTPPAATSQECVESARGAEYIGHRSVTENGRTCQAWRAMVPHVHELAGRTFADNTVRDAGNYCRNLGPNHGDRPWCYTTDPAVEWEYCDIALCG